MLDLFTAFAAMAMLQAPASDADVGCVLAAVPAAERGGLLDEVRNGGQTAPIRDRLVAGARACAEREGWNDARRRHAGRIAAATTAADAARASLARDGFDTSRVDRWLASQVSGNRIGIEVTPEDANRLVTALSAEGVTADVFERLGNTIGIYMQSQLLIERHRRGMGI